MGMYTAATMRYGYDGAHLPQRREATMTATSCGNYYSSAIPGMKRCYRRLPLVDVSHHKGGRGEWQKGRKEEQGSLRTRPLLKREVVNIGTPPTRILKIQVAAREKAGLY